MKAHILIVEDEAILYERLRRVLEKESYSVADYTPSVKDAIARINTKRPDIVLLDIDLQGNETGLELGKLLNTNYKIPFIYVTQYDDNETFFKGLHTCHENFIVKTKPRLNPNDIIRAIYTVLHHKEQENKCYPTEGVFGLVNYLDEIKNLGLNDLSRVPVIYEDIAFFTIKPFIKKDGKEESVRTNYLWFQNKKGAIYFLKNSLKDILSTLPYYFVRVNESYIVNISPHMLQGRINGSKIRTMNRDIIIKDTYKEEVRRRFEVLYK